MNKETQQKQIQNFLKGRLKKDIDAFMIYQWVDRCVAEGWWSLGVMLGPYIPPNALDEAYRKRLDFLLSECRHKQNSVSHQVNEDSTEKSALRTQPTKLFNKRKRLSEGQKIRNDFMQTIKEKVEKVDLTISLSPHDAGVLRASTGKTGLRVDLWIDKDNTLYLGSTFHNLNAKEILLDLLRLEAELIREKTKQSFKLHEGAGKLEYGWIFSEIAYDRSKPLKDHVDLFASKYIAFIRLIRSLVQRF